METYHLYQGSNQSQVLILKRQDLGSTRPPTEMDAIKLSDNCSFLFSSPFLPFLCVLFAALSNVSLPDRLEQDSLQQVCFLSSCAGRAFLVSFPAGRKHSLTNNRPQCSQPLSLRWFYYSQLYRTSHWPRSQFVASRLSPVRVSPRPSEYL